MTAVSCFRSSVASFAFTWAQPAPRCADVTFERAGGGYRTVDRPRDSIGGREAQQRPDALSTGEQAVAHGSMDRRGRNRFGRNQAVELAVDELLLLLQVVAKVHPLSGR